MLYRFIICLIVVCSGVHDQLLAQPASNSFNKQVIDTTVTIGYGVAVGDMDGDGKPDIILADKKQFVWYRNGDWKKFLISENLTQHDNVCIAAEDIDGDGKVEIAVGAQWNPNETSDTTQSGAVFYLKRGKDPSALWEAVRLRHEPTVHRMKWVRTPGNKFILVVVPLHGRGNKQGKGEGVRILAYQPTSDDPTNWPVFMLDSSLHLTHNFEAADFKSDPQGGLYIASKEGIRYVSTSFQKDNRKNNLPATLNYSAGEIKPGKRSDTRSFVATIEPMHGNNVVVYDNFNSNPVRTVLDSSLKEGHGLAVADFLQLKTDQVIAGWRNPDKNGKVGIKIYSRPGPGPAWISSWIDEGGIAVEDLQVADLNGDGKPDIIASGRATHNLVIYWNRNSGK
jgi:hypothetical protein